MTFHSLEYLLFLPLAVAAYFLTPAAWRWVTLLAASMVFYASWRVEFLALLGFTTLLDYLVALALPRARPGLRRLLMGVSLVGNLGLLLFFKFFADDLQLGFDWAFRTDAAGTTPMLLLLPLGISFYTFQTLGYTIDVYRGKRAPERHFGHFAVYVSFFPQLIAGPIERAGYLMPQLRRVQVFDLTRAAAGGALILVGLFKKLVIADSLAPWIAGTMAAPGEQSGLTMLAVALGTAYRYYADLSGYADIAIGSALIMGIRLTQNFRRPFAAGSVTVFWQRWHITVTNWFRDYLYIPLVRKFGGSGAVRALATIVTLVVIGIWHGAAFNWLLIGLVAGLIIGISNWGRKRLAQSAAYTPTVKRAFDWGERAILWLYLPLMGALVAVPQFDGAMRMMARILHAPLELATIDISAIPDFPLHIGVTIIALELYQWLDVRRPVFDRLSELGRRCSWSFYLALIATLMVFGTYDNPDFLYFQF